MELKVVGDFLIESGTCRVLSTKKRILKSLGVGMHKAIKKVTEGENLKFNTAIATNGVANVSMQNPKLPVMSLKHFYCC